jgi:WD40 repeat protein
VTAVRFGPDGRWLITGCTDGSVRVWDTTSSTQVVALEQEGAVTRLALSPDGRVVACVSAGQQATRLWDLDRRSELARIRRPSSPSAVAFSPDGRLLAICDAFGGEVTLWHWRPEVLIRQACSRLMRDLTGDEWRRYFADEAYRRTREASS